MKGVVGFQNKNVRQLWLVLAMVTEGYEAENKQQFVSELIGYTSNQYSFEVRQKALEYCNELQIYTDEVLKNLVNASVHPNWRFKKFARSILDALLENSEYKEQFKMFLPEVSEKEKEFLQAKLSE